MTVTPQHAHCSQVQRLDCFRVEIVSSLPSQVLYMQPLSGQQCFRKTWNHLQSVLMSTCHQRKSIHCVCQPPGTSSASTVNCISSLVFETAQIATISPQCFIKSLGSHHVSEKEEKKSWHCKKSSKALEWGKKL